MRQWRSVRRFLLGILEWSPVAKGMLLMGILLSQFVQYIGWGLYVQARPDADRLVDVDFLRGQFPFMYLLFAVAVLVLLAGLVLRPRLPRAKAYEFLAMMFFSLSLAYYGWLIGPLTLVAGVILAGAPLVGFILFDSRFVAIVWLASLLSLVALASLAAAGTIPYAPIIVPPVPGDLTYARFWTTTHFFWASTPIVSTFALAWFALARWRRREDQFRTLSLTDALTGVHNRRSILDLLEREIARTLRRGPPLAVLLVDLDHFKKINDTHGHPAGDRVLRQSAAALGDGVREYDAVGRWGGEEFLVLLPDCMPDTARRVAERCRERLAALDVRDDAGVRIPVTGSFGLACNAQALDADATTLVRRADAALYRAKQGGRNRVEAG